MIEATMLLLNRLLKSLGWIALAVLTIAIWMILIVDGVIEKINGKSLINF